MPKSSSRLQVKLSAYSSTSRGAQIENLDGITVTTSIYNIEKDTYNCYYHTLLIEFF